MIRIVLSQQATEKLAKELKLFMLTANPHKKKKVFLDEVIILEFQKAGYRRKKI